jgi:hypothetical protein
MRRRYAILGLVVGIALFAFFVPVVYDPPFPQSSECPLATCHPYQASGAYLVSITYFYTGHGGTYYYNAYQVQ